MYWLRLQTFTMSGSFALILLLGFTTVDATRRGFDSLFTKVDRNHDGGLSSQELYAVGGRFGIDPTVIGEALKMTDSDGNRVLSPAEFEQLQDKIDGTGQIRGSAASLRFTSSAVSRLHQSRSQGNFGGSNRNTAQSLVGQQLQSFDTDRNGKLSQREVEQMFSGHGMPFSVAEEAFHQADTDGDWQLDASEMINFYQNAQTSVSNFANSQRNTQQNEQWLPTIRFQQLQRPSLQVFRQQSLLGPFEEFSQPLN